MKDDKKRILIVDDEYFLVETLKTRLEYAGYDVLTAENGADAVTTLEKEPVDLIVMDYMMPVMDGVEATKKIKANKKWKGVPIIFLTARARPEDRKTVYASGAEDYLSKPFETDDLLAMMEKWLSKK